MGLFGLFGQKKDEKNASGSEVKVSRSARKAADKFDCLVKEYIAGEQTEENLRRWASQMEAAAEAAQGLDLKYHFLAYVYEELGDTEKELKYRIRAAETGKAAKQVDLASLYADPDRGCFDLEKAVYWYRKAMAQGEEDAFRKLARLYQQGDGTGAKPDREKVDEFYVAAAELGYFGAYSRAAMCFYEGRGTAQDYRKAYQYADRRRDCSDCSDNYNSMWLVGILKKDGLGTAKDLPGAVKLLEELVRKGYGKAEEALDDARRQLEEQERREEERRAQEKARRQQRLEDARNADPEATALWKRGMEEQDVELVRKAAKLGHPDACYMLALSGAAGSGAARFKIHGGHELKSCIDYYIKYLELGGEKSALIEEGLSERMMEYADEERKKGPSAFAVQWLESAARLGNLMVYYKLAYANLDFLEEKSQLTYSEATNQVIYYKEARKWLFKIEDRREEASKIEMTSGFSLRTEASSLESDLRRAIEHLEKQMDED